MTKWNNLLGFEWYHFFSGDPKRRAEYYHQVITEAADAADLSSVSNESVGVVLSKNDSQILTNRFELIEVGDSIPRLRMKIRIFDRELYNSPMFNLTMALKDPFEKGLTQQEKDWRISLHPNAFTLFNANEMGAFNFGDAVSLREEGGVFFVTQNMARPWTGAGDADADGVLNWQLTDSYRVSNGKNIKGRCNFTWDEYKQLHKTGAFDDLLVEVALRESTGTANRHFSGNEYNVFNYGTGRAGRPGMLRSGKELSELTIEQVMQAQQEGAKEVKVGKNGYKLFATGRFQIIPGTLESAVDKITGCDTSELYGEEAQNAFGVYLMIHKRPKLGAYIMGSSKVTLDQALFQMALEWASVRVRKKTVYKYSNSRPKQTCYPGGRCFGGIGVNDYGLKHYNQLLLPAGHPNKNSGVSTATGMVIAEKTAKAIDDARKGIDNNPSVRAMRDSKCP